MSSFRAVVTMNAALPVMEAVACLWPEGNRYPNLEEKGQMKDISTAITDFH